MTREKHRRLGMQGPGKSWKGERRTMVYSWLERRQDQPGFGYVKELRP